MDFWYENVFLDIFERPTDFYFFPEFSRNGSGSHMVIIKTCVGSMFQPLSFPSPGQPGCRNVRLGGDSAVPPSHVSESWYATYIVYRSFRYPPEIPKLGKM